MARIELPSTDVTYRYVLLPDVECDASNGTVVLRFPTEVEITAKKIAGCHVDPPIEKR